MLSRCTVLGLVSCCLLMACGPVSPEALHEAVNDGNHQRVESLLRRGADPNAPDAEGRTVLQRVLLYRDHDMAKLLLEHGATVTDSVRSLAGMSAMDAALIGRGDTEMFTLIMWYARRQAGEPKTLEGDSSLVMSGGLTGVGNMMIRLATASGDVTPLALSQSETQYVDLPDASTFPGQVVFQTGARYQASGVLIEGVLEVEEFRLLEADEGAQTIVLPVPRYLPTSRASMNSGLRGLMPKRSG